jgi:XTP/dITP diphosphohydrolase
VKILLATRSAHKAAEIRRVLADVPGLEVVDLEGAGIPHEAAEEALEVFDTFEENAGAKARHFQERSGIPTVADDSGLEVDVLDGAPGVRSKRFAPVSGLSGADLDGANNRHLLEALRGQTWDRRGARFICVAVLDRGDGRPLVFRGEARGRILEEPRGREGFGYDPLFYDEELEKTFAEIAREEKNLRSHRGKAFQLLARFLKVEVKKGNSGRRANGG